MFNSVLVSPFGLIRYRSIWSYSVLYSPLWSDLVHYVQFSPLRCIWSYSVHFGHSLSTKVLFGPFGLIGFYSVHFSHIWSIMFNLVLFSLIWSILSTLVSFSHIQSTLGLFCHFGPIWSFSVHYGPELTEVNRMDLIELRCSEVDQIGPQLTKVDWSRLIQIELMKWTECQFVISIAKIVFWYKFKSLLSK